MTSMPAVAATLRAAIQPKVPATMRMMSSAAQIENSLFQARSHCSRHG